MSGAPMPRQTAVLLYVIYDHPRDFPEEYVCRRWELDQLLDEGLDPFLHSTSLEEIRRQLPPDLVKIRPWGHDDPVILEIWI